MSGVAAGETHVALEGEFVTSVLKSHDVAPGAPMSAVLLVESKLVVTVVPTAIHAPSSAAVMVICANAGVVRAMVKHKKAQHRRRKRLGFMMFFLL